MFWAIREKLIDLSNFKFSFQAFDTQTLNQLAKSNEYDVIAISLANYTNVHEKYEILTHGASVGDNYGPVLITKEPCKLEDLKSKVIGIPGKDTTAARILSLILPDALTIEISISPYQKIFDALENNEIQAALLIHEGQITYKSKGYSKVIDIGEWWKKQHNLPLPLGVNVIKKDLGNNKKQISQIIKKSIRYSLDNKSELLTSILEHGQDRGVEIMNASDVANYLSMYANNNSYQISSDCKKAISLIAGPTIKVGYCD